VTVAQALKQGVDSLAGSRGPDILTRAVTYYDLIDLDLITQQQVSDPSSIVAIPTPYILEFNIGTGPLTAGVVIGFFKLAANVLFPVAFGALPKNLAGSSAGCMSVPTSAASLPVQYCPVNLNPATVGNWVTFGHVLFAVGAFVGTFTTVSAVPPQINRDSMIRILGPTPGDASLGFVAITLVGQANLE
jgi:hypothetical protein